MVCSAFVFVWVANQGGQRILHPDNILSVARRFSSASSVARAMECLRISRLGWETPTPSSSSRAWCLGLSGARCFSLLTLPAQQTESCSARQRAARRAGADKSGARRAGEEDERAAEHRARAPRRSESSGQAARCDRAHGELPAISSSSRLPTKSKRLRAISRSRSAKRA